MYEGKKIGVVVPAHNEESLIGRVLETMPECVDSIIVVDDKSSDRTADVVEEYSSALGDRLVLIGHEKNRGVGAAIVTGYKEAVARGLDIVAVMAGDAQMNPEELPCLLDPIVKGKADYVKGNRFWSGEAWGLMPKYRYIGNAFLSLFTKIVSGYWNVADSQSGYTAISCPTLALLDLDRIYERYGMPNDILIKLNIVRARVRDVPISPIYNVGEKTEIKLRKVAPAILWILFKGFFKRMKDRYVIRDFHPLVFFYLLSFLLLSASTLLFVRLVLLWTETAVIPKVNALAWMFSTAIGFQSLFFAMWFDMEENKHLR